MSRSQDAGFNHILEVFPKNKHSLGDRAGRLVFLGLFNAKSDEIPVGKLLLFF
ncbi:hypothetical protein RB2501_15934 [Robiginitalea biformata HTCC2501]|uniref:Uncharacterized protein n=1 Tax=Robiginitalea biformata (strain ATCC BAA-864 / DSM 15991 / KCTC 12146 / HTCC2501) TaxID=313596 RepID=A4CLT4_ROBBH|nr:hypothetical protein RB2501_15934 [Robiginitalea biformata HTCC2501]